MGQAIVPMCIVVGLLVGLAAPWVTGLGGAIPGMLFALGGIVVGGMVGQAIKGKE
ncbi:MAG: hypothetical protein AAGF31_09020 [Planctomycetota bacterium]